MYMKRYPKKGMATLLSIVLLFQTCPLVTMSHATENAITSQGTGTLGSLQVDCIPSVTYNEKENNYQLKLDLNTEFYEHAINTDPSVPARGYFTTNYDGWYLVELWGGDGAAGPGDSGRLGGDGGAGGYVYGKVYLKAGQTLYYSLGGDGRYTYISGEGGGANGGGHGGSTLTYGVGGGGGYSALFLFPETEGSNTFANLYLDESGNFTGDNIREYDRATKYIMIAGGGGGGGAADGASLSGSTGNRRPIGGAGGHMDTPVKGTISGDGLTVAGTFYAGEDGQFSGNSDAYIGHGGTGTPGEVASTTWNWASGEMPNDWTGAYNSAIPGGSGGAGNLRGGSGGAGFCGGSGGIQQSLVSATQIGGGGGGSSFVAKAVNGKNILTTRTDDIETGITDAEYAILDKVNNEEGCTGGRVAITYLAGEHQQDDIAKAKDLAVSFIVSPYFNISDLKSTQLRYEIGSDGTVMNSNVTYNAETGLLTLNGISLIPTETNLDGNLEIYLTLTPKVRFKGGNDVPLLQNDTVMVATGEETCSIPLNKNLTYVNVPLNFTVDVRNHTYTSTGAEDWYVHLGAANMYNIAADEEAQASVGSDSMYDFIASISRYAVGNMPSTGLNISTTTTVPVGFIVVPKDDVEITPVFGPATIGETVFTADATVTILAPHDGYIHGQKMQFVKNLSDNGDGTYQFSITTSADNTKTSHRPEYHYDPSNASAGTPIPIEHDGVYLVQVWGGDGHEGVGASGWFSSASGGDGGKGGYSYAYLTLKTGDQLIIEQMGRQGSEAVSNTGGGGGTYTAVSVNYAVAGATDEMLVIAGGGGGGGNAVTGGWIGSGLINKPGEAGANANTDSNSVLADLTTYNGGKGGVGDSSNNASPVGGAGGSAGGNYYSANAHIAYNANLFESHDGDTFTANDLQEYLDKKANPSSVAGGGAVDVFCLWLNNHEHVAAVLEDYALDLELSPYFTIRKIDGSYITGYNNGVSDENRPLVYENATFEDQTLKVTKINPHQTRVNTGEGLAQTYHSSINFTISMTLEPRDGFLGGNHVPILMNSDVNANARLSTGAKMLQKLRDGDTVGMDEAAIGKLERTDYANVPLQIESSSLGRLTANDVHIDVDAPDTEKTVARSALYNWDPMWERPTGDSAWTAHFVQPIEILGTITEPEGDEIPVPAADVGWAEKLHTSNAHYAVVVGVGPTAEAKSGIVGTPAQNCTLDPKRANVYVQHRMLYALTGVKPSHAVGPDNCESMDAGKTFEVTLVPEAGYTLPTSVTLCYNNENGTPDANRPVPFAYNSATGKISVQASAITDSMTLTAVGILQSYKIYFGHEVVGSEEPEIHSITLPYGASLADYQRWEEDFRPNDVTGYTFAWKWRTGMETPNDSSDDGLVPVTMPAYDLWVVGEYTPREFLLYINYGWADSVKEGDDSLLPAAHEQTIRFGEDFHITSPAITGYVADPLFVKGTVNADIVENLPSAGDNTPTIYYTVTYSPTQNQLRIDYIMTDTGETTVYKATLNTGAEYHVDIPQKEGYTTYIRGDDSAPATVIEGTMPAEGVSIVVLYRPNTYQVTFSLPDGATCAETMRTVTFNAEYGAVTPLPTQVLRDGYEFIGWYLPDSEGNPTGERIQSSTLVRIAADHTLVADWKPLQYALVVEHVYADGTKAAKTETFMVDYGAAFKDYCRPQTLNGYTAYVIGSNGGYMEVPDEIPGTMPAHSVTRTFYYLGNPSTLTIYYKYAQNGNEAAPDYISGVGENPVLRYGDSFSIDSPVLDGYVCSQPVISGTMDTETKEYTVYYYSQSPVFNVTITWGPDGDSSSAMQFEYDWGNWNPETHSYENSRINPVKPDANRVNVANNDSTMGNTKLSIDAELRYIPHEDYRNIGGYFTAGSETITTLTGIKNNSNKSAWLWLTGSLPTSVVGQLSVGKCVVSITAAGGGN